MSDETRNYVILDRSLKAIHNIATEPNVNRLIAKSGPCSSHHEAYVMQYVERDHPYNEHEVACPYAAVMIAC